jgi:two-component system, LytTR family, sensor kinase
MSRYWKYQLLGWLSYSAFGIVINLANGVSPGPLFVGHTVMVSTGIGLTHLLRREIHRRRSPGQPIADLWPLLAGASFAISIILAALVIGLNTVLTQGKWDLVAMLGLWWGMLLAAGIWTVLYVRFSDQRRHELREAQMQGSLREARLQALESQLNPHFLFNSLNSIRALVEMDPPRAQDMLTRLANVLRNSLLQDVKHTVPLAQELQVVSDYLALETVRFEDRLRVQIRIAEDASKFTIPPMVLQTLVENAIKHGISRTKGPGDLRIEAARQGDDLEISVENTGKLREPNPDSVLLGHRNIRERLSLLYGDQASLRLEENGDLVKATLLLPVLQ